MNDPVGNLLTSHRSTNSTAEYHRDGPLLSFKRHANAFQQDIRWDEVCRARFEDFSNLQLPWFSDGGSHCPGLDRLAAGMHLRQVGVHSTSQQLHDRAPNAITIGSNRLGLCLSDDKAHSEPPRTEWVGEQLVFIGGCEFD